MISGSTNSSYPESCNRLHEFLSSASGGRSWWTTVVPYGFISRIFFLLCVQLILTHRSEELIDLLTFQSASIRATVSSNIFFRLECSFLKFFFCLTLVRLHEIFPLSCKPSICWVLQNLGIFYGIFYGVSSTINTLWECHMWNSFAQHCLTALQQEINKGQAHMCGLLSS